MGGAALHLGLFEQPGPQRVFQQPAAVAECGMRITEWAEAAGGDGGMQAERRTSPCCAVWRLGLREYAETLELQRRLARARMAGEVPDLLLLAQHPPVITCGRGARPEHLLAAPEDLRRRGVGLYAVERGGDVTYHGPGQLVGYPILDLHGYGLDVHLHLRRIERAVIGALAAAGLAAGVSPGRTGVWVGDRKIASIGIHVSRWVTWHGFALNVCTDLRDFDLIVPCGLPGVRMTSLAAELGRDVGVAEVEPLLVAAFAEAFGAAVRPWGPGDAARFDPAASCIPG
jgi:lipoate-protein ligase B